MARVSCLKPRKRARPPFRERCVNQRPRAGFVHKFHTGQAATAGEAYLIRLLGIRKCVIYI